MKKKLRKIFAWTLAICLIMTVVNIPMVVRAEDTPITSMELTNSNIPEVITSDMKITDVMQSVTCNTQGCSIVEAETMWYITAPADGLPSEDPVINQDTVLNVGDKIELSITLTADENYEFAAKNPNATFGSADFDGMVTFNGKIPNPELTFLWAAPNANEKYKLIVGIEYIVEASGDNQPGGGERSYTVDFGTGSWVIGEVTVNADKAGEQTLTDSDIITLTNFNAETMEARIKTEDGFSATLTVTDNKTSISTRNNSGGVPDEIIFEIAEKNSGGQDPAPGDSNRFEIALDNVEEGGVLLENLGYVQYAVVDPSTSEVHPVSLNEDYDGDGDDVILTIGNTGGDNPRVKYTYTVKDTTKNFMLYVTPAEGKTATVQMDNQGTITSLGSYSYPDFMVRNLTANAFYRVEFTDAGGSEPGGNTDGSDAAPGNDAAVIQFYDSFGNNFSYGEFKRANLGTVQYSTDNGNTWNEFTAENVTSDEKLFWYTDKTDPEPANWKQIYYFNADDAGSVKLKVTDGKLSYNDSEQSGTGLTTDFVNNDEYSDLLKSAHGLVIKPQDDGVRNITWSDEAEQADQRVEHGKVIIEKAVIGDENALISDEPYSQQGNKGYIGIKGGATVTVKLIPDYGYQVGSLELNGQRLAPQEEEATYTFTMPDTNLHLRAIFDESSDEIKAIANGVNGGSITGGENVIASGNLRLSVSDSTMSDEQKTTMNNSSAAAGVTITNYLEVDLEKFVKKGDSDEEWTEDLEELSNKIKIVLSVGTDLDAAKSYVVVREHNGVYEQIPAVYDKNAGTLTFESDKFSDYAVGTMENGNTDDDSNNGSSDNPNEDSSVNDTTNPDNSNKNDDAPKTGDKTPIELYMILALISGIGLITVSKKRVMSR